MPRSNMGVPSSIVGASRSKGVSSIPTSQLAERIYCSGIVLCITTNLQTGVRKSNRRTHHLSVFSP